jgi:uncharacterized membrane protein (DUF485 family)
MFKDVKEILSETFPRKTRVFSILILLTFFVVYFSMFFAYDFIRMEMAGTTEPSKITGWSIDIFGSGR